MASFSHDEIVSRFTLPVAEYRTVGYWQFDVNVNVNILLPVIQNLPSDDGQVYRRKNRFLNIIIMLFLASVNIDGKRPELQNQVDFLRSTHPSGLVMLDPTSQAGSMDAKLPFADVDCKSPEQMVIDESQSVFKVFDY